MHGLPACPCSPPSAAKVRTALFVVQPSGLQAEALALDVSRAEHAVSGGMDSRLPHTYAQLFSCMQRHADP